MKWFQVAFNVILVLSFILRGTVANPDAKRLYDDLLSNYNKLVRPVVNVTDALTVRIKLKLSQLIDVNLKNQIMTTNLWVEQTWYDYKLKWEPKEYGGVEMLHVPSDHIWRPDIVLYNNADGNFEVTLATKATLNYTGRVEWRPPAIYKSSCEIDVEYFPFDEQTCVMKFGSWTYDGFQVDLRHIDEMNGTNIVDVGVDLSEFYTSVEWDILEVPAVRNEKFYTCCDEPYLDITFNITMRRKTLFYTVNLIIPCMGISFLTILVFYLPSDSGEKVSLSISILLSLTVFFLLLAEIIPPTSLVVPLLGKFVLFTMILDTFSICVTVLVLNIHFRSPQTHVMAPWVRTLFIQQLPRLLVMRRPLYPISEMIKSSRRLMVRTCNGFELKDQIPPLPPPVALSRLHHSPHKTSRSTSPHLLHRVQSFNVLDEACNAIYGSGFINGTGTAAGIGISTVNGIPNGLSGGSVDVGIGYGATSLMYLPLTVNQETSTTSSLLDSLHQSQYQQTSDSLLDHPLTPTKFRQKTSISVQTNGLVNDGDYLHYQKAQKQQQVVTEAETFLSQRAVGISASTTTLHQQTDQQHQYQYQQQQQPQQQQQQQQKYQQSVTSTTVTVTATVTAAVATPITQTYTHQLYRQQSTSSVNFSPVPAPLHPHQQHQSTSTCDLLGNSNTNVMKSTTTVNSVATASTLAGSCCSVNGGAVQVHQGLGTGAALQSAELQHSVEQQQHQYHQQHKHEHQHQHQHQQQQQQPQPQPQQPQQQQNQKKSMNTNVVHKKILPPCQIEGGPHCCSQNQSKARYRLQWHKCPEIFKAMDGVTYIAEQTRKEEESTRVKEDWKFVAMVLDRLFLWIFTIAVVVGTAGIILQAPTLYDTRIPIDVTLSEISSTTAKPNIAKPTL